MAAEQIHLQHVKSPASLLDKISDFGFNERLTSQISIKGGKHYEFFSNHPVTPSIILGVDCVRGQMCIYNNNIGIFTQFVKNQDWRRGFLVPYKDEINMDTTDYPYTKAGLLHHLNESSIGQRLVFSALGLEESKIIEQVYKEQNITIESIDPEIVDVYTYDISDIQLKLSELQYIVDGCENGSSVSSISEAEAVTVNNFWTYKNQTSLQFLQWTAQYSETSCLKVNDEMASWIIQYTDGNIGALYTPVEHRNKGYAKKCIAGMLIKLLKKNEYIPYVFIVDTNRASQSLFSSLGFKKLKFQVQWLIAINEN